MPFTNVSIILPVMNETHSLRQTVDMIEASSATDVAEYLMVVCKHTTEEAMAVCREIEARDSERFRVLMQERPFLGGAIRDAFDAAVGSHVLMMASDLETDPADVPVFIREAKNDPEAVVTATRWVRGKGFSGYDPLKLVLNFVFQKIFGILYGVRLSDMTYGYRIFPTPLVRSIRWEELKHPFLFETAVKPLRLGVRFIEIPSAWKARTEGESQNTFFNNFKYFPVGFRVRFASRESLLTGKNPGKEHA